MTDVQWRTLWAFMGKVIFGVIGWVAFWTGLSRLIY
jgi:hypothetical protein